jgi:hypothetical protein
MKAATKLRLFGGLVLIFNLWLIGRHSLEGVPVLLLTFGFAIGFEFLVVRPISKKQQSQNINGARLSLIKILPQSIETKMTTKKGVPQYSCSQQLEELRQKPQKNDSQYLLSFRITIGIFIVIVVSMIVFSIRLAYVIAGISSLFMLFFGGIAIVTKIAKSHLANAVHAIDNGKIVKTSVQIEIETDDEYDDKYFVIVQDTAKKTWKFFFSPSGWQPVAGKLEIEAYFLDNVHWPVLLIAEAGIMYPTSKPTIQRKPQI